MESRNTQFTDKTEKPLVVNWSYHTNEKKYQTVHVSARRSKSFLWRILKGMLNHWCDEFIFICSAVLVGSWWSVLSFKGPIRSVVLVGGAREQRGSCFPMHKRLPVPAPTPHSRSLQLFFFLNFFSFRSRFSIAWYYS